MRTLLPLIFIFSLLSVFSVQAQGTDQSHYPLSCHTDAYLRHTWATVDGAKDKFDAWNHKMILAGRETYSSDKTSEIKFRIPVVVHVIHEFGPENISERQVKSQIDALNRDYNFLSAETGISFEFFLAQKDPQGNCSNGITRTYSPYTIHGFGGFNASSEAELKGLISWPSDRYLNIWLVKSIDQKVLGYSYVGVNPTFNWDGVVIRAKNFGQTDAIAPPYSLGRTTVHEIGHWLGLFHPFTVGYCCDDLTTSCDSCGDYICDTPNADTVVYGCPKNINSCVDHPIDYPDALDNFMGYSDDRCMDKFTPGQITRMKNLLIAERTNLHSENNLRLTGYYGCVASVTDHIADEFNIFPTLATQTINFHLKTNQKANLQITDLTGRILFEKQINETNGFLNVETLSSGTYFVKIISNEKVTIKKWVKL